MAKGEYTKIFLESVYQQDNEWTNQHIKDTVDALDNVFIYEELEGVTTNQYRKVCMMLIEILYGEMNFPGCNDTMCNTEVRSCFIEILRNLKLQTNEEIKNSMKKYIWKCER